MNWMKYILALLCVYFAALPATAATPQHGTAVFAVVMSRHGVRSFTHDPPGYAWPPWAPVAPGYLTAHGYRLMTLMGAYYRRFFASEGLPIACRSGGLYVYADLDQRTLATAKALIQGACGSADAIAYEHAAASAPGAFDPLFDGADWMGPAHAIDAATSVAAVRDAASPLSALIPSHAPAFAALQQLMDPLCATGSCPAVTSGANDIVAKKSGLAELIGPVDSASSDAESLFLSTAECGPALNEELLERAMTLHVLEYVINARNSYTPLVKGGTIFAHIVGLLQERAGMRHPDVTLADIGRARVVMLSGHDTQLGALGGLLRAHWTPGGGIAPDDMPPGSALIFELDRMPSGAYDVDVRFVSQSLAQFRSNRALVGGVDSVAVMRAPLARFASLAHDLTRRGFVKREWTAASAAPLALAPLTDPAWSRCAQ